MRNLEQQRRDLIQSNRPLYNYIVDQTAAKILDSFGDQISGRDHGLANLAWSESARYRQKAEDSASLSPGEVR